MSQFGLKVISNEAYHSGPGVSKSHLDSIVKSPAHYYARYLAPERKPFAPTPTLVLGTAIHGAILEPDRFAIDFAIEPAFNKRTNAGKEEHAAWLKTVGTKTVITQDQADTAMACQAAVRKHPMARQLFTKHGAAEQSYFACDPETGELVKCRTDWIDWNASRIVDVKTTLDAGPGFVKSIVDYRYHVQEAWYRDVIANALDGEAPREWIFLAIEKEPPYAVGLWILPTDLVKAGRIEAARNLAQIAAHKKSGDWPDYGAAGAQEIEVPGWARRKFGLDSAEVAFSD